MRILQEFLPQYCAKFVFLKQVRIILSCLGIGQYKIRLQRWWLRLCRMCKDREHRSQLFEIYTSRGNNQRMRLS